MSRQARRAFGMLLVAAGIVTAAVLLYLLGYEDEAAVAAIIGGCLAAVALLWAPGC